jgi:hypothetical protein
MEPFLVDLLVFFGARRDWNRSDLHFETGRDIILSTSYGISNSKTKKTLSLISLLRFRDFER